MGIRTSVLPAWAWVLGVSLTCSSALAASKITAIDFKGTSDPAEISIQADGPLDFEKTENTAEKQVVLEFKNAVIAKANTRKLDTSSFDSNVTLISPYKATDQKDTVRVVIQLRENGTADVTSSGNSVQVKIPNSSMASNDLKIGDSPSSAKKDSSFGADAMFSSSDETAKKSAKTSPSSPMSDEKKFVGAPVTFQVRDAEVSEVLRLIGEASGFNIIVGDGVKGKVTLSLTDVPWDQALDVVLHTLHLGAERTHNILRVVPLADLTAEKMAELKAAQAAEAATPRITKVFPVNYADPSELSTIISKFLSSSTSAQQGQSIQGDLSGAIPPVIQVDTRTNSLIVRDLPQQVDRVEKLIRLLDTQTPQVVIEAKVIEALEGFSKSLSGSLGLGFNPTSSNAFASFAGGNPVDALVGTPGVFASGSDISNRSSPSSGTPNGTFGFSPTLSFLPGSPRLNALLSWGESESQIKIVSSPKTVVLNKQKANIVQGTPVLVPGTTTVAGVGLVQTATVQSANVSLDVKPTVTNDGSVLLDLTVTKDIPVTLPGGNQGIGNRRIQTMVIVDSGSTLVIGGIYSLQTNHVSQGFPFLRKIPILGALFGSDTESTDRSELFIFITPRILNPKETGISS